jgi:long-chain fatty acid transport protein
MLTRSKSPRFLPLSLLLLSAFLASAAFAVGLRLPETDAFALSRGEAFTATADNPSAVYYNPAGITQLDGFSCRLSTFGIYADDRFRVKGQEDTHTIDSFQVVPNFFATYKPAQSRVAFGLGVYSPFGLGLKWPDDVPFRTVGRESKVAYLRVNPVMAIELFKGLSIAVGPTFNYSQVEKQTGIVVPGDTFKYEGSGTDYGFTAGILWQPLAQHAFGLSYYSATDIRFSGHSTIELPRYQLREMGHADLNFPQFVRAGYSFRPTPQWNLEFDLDWTDWDSLNTPVLHNDKTGDVLMPFNWKSSLLYEVGVTRYFNNGLHVSAGYIYNQNSIPDSSFNPLVPDSGRHLFSAGLGGKFLDHYTWDLGYQLIYGPTRTIQIGSSVDGSYRLVAHGVCLSLGYHF